MSDSTRDGLRDRLVLLFREELQDNLWILAAGVAELEGRPGGETEHGLIPELFRAAHSLKGAAHSAGVVAAVEPCHRLEELLALLRDGERALDDDVLGVFTQAIDDLAVLDRQMGETAAGPLGDETRDNDESPIVRTVADGTTGLRARVEVSELNDLVGRAGVLVAATARLHLLAQSLGAERDATEPGGSTERFADEASAVDRDLGHAARQLVEAAQELRMQPVNEVAAGLEHTVRELARSMGKQAELSMTGGDLKVDRDVGDALREPLLHLVRNAVGHGLETADERVRRGKSPVGEVRIEASLQGGLVRIIVADDGRGIDIGALQSAVHDGADNGDGGIELAFQAGVSTASTVSDISGRGVGLDAVRTRVESLGGTVHLQMAGTDDAAAGGGLGGAQAVIQVPTTLSVVRIVLVEAAGELIGLPAGAVSRARRVEPADLRFIDGQLVLISAGDARPVVSLGGALGLRTADDDDMTRTVIELIDERSMLLVDRVDTEFEGVLKRLPPRTARASSVLGAVVLPTGRAALVVNPAACLRAAAAGVPAAPSSPTTSPVRRVILLAEDTLTTRALERSILVGAGYEVIDVPNGAEAWKVLNERPVDVVVSDVDMPHMGGIELCRSIRSSPRFGQIPVVLVTSMGSDDDRRRGVEAGANAYLVKSAFDQATLLDAVRRVL